MTELSIKDFVAVKAKLPWEELHVRFGDDKGKELTDRQLMNVLMNYYERENMIKRLRAFKKDFDDVLAILEPTVLR